MAVETNVTPRESSLSGDYRVIIERNTMIRRLLNKTLTQGQDDKSEWIQSTNEKFMVASCYTIITCRGRIDVPAKKI